MNITIENLPIIAIITPFLIAFVIGIISNKYLNIKRILVIGATIISLISIFSLVKPVIINGDIITIWLGNWIPIENNVYGIGLEVDGLSVFIGLIIAIASVLSVIYSIKYMENDNGVDKYYVLFLLLVGSMIGLVFTGDLFNMYVMLEIMTFAAIGLTAFRNNKDKSMEAAFKYIVTGSLGSSLILLGTAILYIQTKTLNLAEISLYINSNETMEIVTILSLTLMIVGYAVKSFMVPCHTWPTDAHMAAPSSISMILSGVMSKTGIYGLIRIIFLLFGLSSNKTMGYLILVWGVITMVVGVSMALIQHDFKRLLAFHSVSQIGYIVTALGIAILESGVVSAVALTGALYHMINHAIFKGLLFLVAGAVLYRTGTTDLDKVSGLGKNMPGTMTMFLFGAAAISGIPLLNGFASKWMIYEAGISSSYGLVSVIAVVVSALTLASFIKVGHSVFFGFIRKEHENIEDVPLSMRIPMLILSLGTVIFGIFPNIIINKLLYPIVNSICNVSNYITAALGDEGYTLNLNVKIIGDSISEIGIYNPSNFLVLFILLVISIFLFFIFKSESIGEELFSTEKSTFDLEIFKKFKGSNKYGKKKYEAQFIDECRYDTFVGGEKGEDIKIGANDLFWGMKYQFRGYFDFIKKAHSGNINDYSLWIITTLAIVIIIGIIFI